MMRRKNEATEVSVTPYRCACQALNSESDFDNEDVVKVFFAVASLAAVAWGAYAELACPQSLSTAQYTADQEKAAAEFEVARNVPVLGPFELLMHSPEVMNREHL